MRSRAASVVWLACCLGFAAVASAKDRGADGDFEKRVSSHFVLYQDVDIDRTSGFRGSRRFENQVLDSLESAYDALDKTLGLRPSRRIEVRIWDSGIFDQHFAGLFRFSAAGFYSGTIHIRGDIELRSSLIRTLHHELVHAAWDVEAPSLVLPAWLNEGLAEWFEARAVGKRRLAPGEAQAMAQLASQGQLGSLWNRNSVSFAHLEPEAARSAYLQSYAFLDFLARRHGDDTLRRLNKTLLRKRKIDRAFDLTFGASLDELVARFAAEYGS
jgi:hypothetical protein